MHICNKRYHLNKIKALYGILSNKLVMESNTTYSQPSSIVETDHIYKLSRCIIILATEMHVYILYWMV